MSSWLEPLNRIFESESGDLRALAKAVGANPEIFYVGRDLSKCNLRGQDLRGMNLTGAKIDPSTLDDRTLIDPQFDPRFVFESNYIQIGLREEVLALVLAYSEAAHYTYKAWGLKALLEYGVNQLSKPSEVAKFIHSSDAFRDLSQPAKGKMRRMTVQVYPYIQEFVHHLQRDRGEKTGIYIYNELVVAGLVKSQLRDLKKDYSNIDPLALFKNTRDYLAEVKKGRRYFR